MSEQEEREISFFDFRKFGKLTLTEKRLKGTLFSFQKAKQPRQQVGNTIAEKVGEEKIDHLINATLDRITRINVNEGILIGPTIYMWDVFVVLVTIFLFRFVGNHLLSSLAWMKWFSLGMLYGIYWGHDWVKRWVNFHFMLDGTPYRVLVDKARMDEALQFVESIKATRASNFATVAPLTPDMPREKQVKLGMSIMAVGCVIALVLALCSGGGDCSVVKSGNGMTQKEEYECLMRQFIDINRRKGVPSFGIKEAQEAIDVTVEYSPVKISRTKLLKGMIKELGENPNPYAYREKTRDQEQ